MSSTSPALLAARTIGDSINCSIAPPPTLCAAWALGLCRSLSLRGSSIVLVQSTLCTIRERGDRNLVSALSTCASITNATLCNGAVCFVQANRLRLSRTSKRAHLRAIRPRTALCIRSTASASDSVSARDKSPAQSFCKDNWLGSQLTSSSAKLFVAVSTCSCTRPGAECGSHERNKSQSDSNEVRLRRSEVGERPEGFRWIICDEIWLMSGRMCACVRACVHDLM